MRSYTLTPTRKSAGKALARRSRCALMSELLKDPANTKYLLRRIGILLRRELALMCSDRTNSILRSQSMSDLRNFTWNSLLSELSLKLLPCYPFYNHAHTCHPRQNRSAVTHRNFAEKGTGTDVFRSNKFHSQEPVYVRLEKLHME